jgi:hypothetical protein
MGLDDTLNRLQEPMQKIQINVCKTPVLTCAITGRTRLTNKTYLEGKAETAPGENLQEKVENFKKTYICKEAAKLLRGGKSVADARGILGVDTPVQDLTDEQAQLMLKLNGARNKSKPSPAPDPDIPWYDGDL